ncbi:hypothetical protein CDIMF43_200070 [Carnobacterium divergens]|nr:hypothetical protein CDIMF43_200070 [Carnobacterium divergens]
MSILVIEFNVFFAFFKVELFSGNSAILNVLLIIIRTLAFYLHPPITRGTQKKDKEGALFVFWY